MPAWMSIAGGASRIVGASDLGRRTCCRRAFANCGADMCRANPTSAKHAAHGRLSTVGDFVDETLAPQCWHVADMIMILDQLEINAIVQLLAWQLCA